MLADVLSNPLGFSAIIDPSSKSIPEILRAAHDEAGHMSVKYTLQNIENLFTWPNMRADVDNYVRSCKICLKVNSVRPHTKEPLQKLRPPALQIEDHIHIDLVDMPKATSGHVAVCTLVDSTTGYTVLQPVLDKTSQWVSSTLLTHYIPYFGVPKVLVTDKGKENANSEIKKLTERYNIQHIFSSTSHPQSNGKVEGRQQMITQFSKKTISNIWEQKNWPYKVPELQTIINSTTSSSRGYSPFFLAFLKHPNFPFQKLINSSPDYSDQSMLTTRFNLSNQM